MLLHEQIARSLRDLKGQASPAPRTVGWSAESGPAVEIDFTAVDALSCAFRELRVTADGLKAASLDALRAWADEVCRKVTYLLEQLGPLEIDRQEQAVLVRSNPPAKEADKTSFYEMFVKAPGVVSLRRYSRPARDAEREPLDIQVTHEVLQKLVRDIVGAIPEL